MVGQALTGKRQSIPKVTNIKADDDRKIVFKNMGNNHAYPFIWADTLSISAGTSVIVASGVEFHGKKLATYGNIVATPRSDVGGNFYIERDTVNNVVTLKTASTVTADFDVQIIIGGNSTARYIESYVK